jgi:nucleoside-triphosphate--adenylate kinase
MSSRLISAIILGAPGGGKGTISKKIVKDFGWKHVSSGDILRKHVLDKTPIGLQAQTYMASGSLVPDALVIGMLLGEASPNSSLLLDGFPRTLNQAEALSKAVKIDLVLCLDIPHQTIIDRISKLLIVRSYPSCLFTSIA